MGLPNYNMQIKFIKVILILVFVSQDTVFYFFFILIQKSTEVVLQLIINTSKNIKSTEQPGQQG
jgi:hypothetical protein